jgi:hypothetical protein
VAGWEKQTRASHTRRKRERQMATDRARQIEQLRAEQLQLLEAMRRRAQYIEHLQAIPPRRIRTTGRQAQANALQGGVSLPADRRAVGLLREIQRVERMDFRALGQSRRALGG